MCRVQDRIQNFPGARGLSYSVFDSNQIQRSLQNPLRFLGIRSARPRARPSVHPPPGRPSPALWPSVWILGSREVQILKVGKSRFWEVGKSGILGVNKSMFWKIYNFGTRTHGNVKSNKNIKEIQTIKIRTRVTQKVDKVLINQKNPPCTMSCHFRQCFPWTE